MGQQEFESGRDEEKFAVDMKHVNHCFDYIRQGIMCAGDMPIEGAAKMVEGESHVDRVNGYGGRHQCKNYVSPAENEITIDVVLTLR